MPIDATVDANTMQIWLRRVSAMAGAEILVAASYYGTTGAKATVKAAKRGDVRAIATMAAGMVALVPPGYILEPVPGHTGRAKTTHSVSLELRKLCGNPTMDVMRGPCRASRAEAKRVAALSGVSHVGGLCDVDMVFECVELGAQHLLIEDVVATGVTAVVAIKATGASRLLAFAGDETA
jgi:hypothetical protein